MLDLGAEPDIVGVSIIGAGERGIYFVGSRMAEIAAETGFRIVGVHDRLEDRAKHAADHLNDIYRQKNINHRVRIFSDLEQAAADQDVRLVIVTTHTDAHRLPTLTALNADKHVYLD